MDGSSSALDRRRFRAARRARRRDAARSASDRARSRRRSRAARSRIRDRRRPSSNPRRDVATIRAASAVSRASIRCFSAYYGIETPRSFTYTSARRVDGRRGFAYSWVSRGVLCGTEYRILGIRHSMRGARIANARRRRGSRRAARPARRGAASSVGTRVSRRRAGPRLPTPRERRRGRGISNATTCRFKSTSRDSASRRTRC